MSARFVLTRSGEQFHFNLVARNGEKILTSQMYAAKSSATSGIASVKENAADDSRYERLSSKSEQPYFVLKAGNGEVIGSSQMYSSPSAMETGIASVMANAAGAAIDDQC